MELVIRDRNVLVTVNYVVDQPMSQATRRVENLGRAMLEELNDYLSN